MLRRAFLAALPLITLWLLAFAVRLAPYRQVFSPTPFADGSRVSLFDTDPYYHVRRVMLFMRTFPSVQYHDSYYAYPAGGEVMWPPLFDWAIAGAARLLGYSPDHEEPLLRFLAFIPPILGAFSVLLAYALARQVMDKWSALVGAALLAFIPGHALYSILVRLDHHAGEMVTVLVMILLFILSAKRIQATGTPHRWLAIAWGAAMACALATTLGALAFIVLLAGFVALEAVLLTARGNKDLALSFLRSSRTAFLTAFILLIPLCRRPPWFTPSQEIRMGLSWSHLYVVGAILIILLVLERACRVMPSGRRPAGLMAGLVLALGVTAIALPAFAAPWLLKPIGIAGTYFAKADPWLRMIWETQPLLFDRGEFHPDLAAEMLTGFVFVYPILAIALLLMRIRGREASIVLGAFVYWAVAMGLLGFARKRFVYLFAIAVSLVVGAFLVWAVRRLWRLGAAVIAPSPSRNHALRWAGLGGLALGCGICLYLSLSCFKQILCEGVFWNRPSDAMRETFAWMRRNTPPTSFFDSPGHRPEYGVIYESDRSMWLLFYAHRPIVGAFWDKRVTDVFRFYVSEDEHEANTICDRTRTRYVVSYPILFFVRDYAEISGLNPDRYMLLIQDPKTGKPKLRATERIWRLIGQRLYDWDGVAPGNLRNPPPSLQRYRLVHESDSFSDPSTGMSSTLKVFEYVRGAKILGHTEPRAAVRAEVSIVTNRNRPFTYAAEAQADERGKFALTVPYATTPAVTLEPCTRSVSDYRVSSLGREVFTGVTEDDVLQGYEVPVAFRVR